MKDDILGHRQFWIEIQPVCLYVFQFEWKDFHASFCIEKRVCLQSLILIRGGREKNANNIPHCDEISYFLTDAKNERVEQGGQRLIFRLSY